MKKTLITGALGAAILASLASGSATGTDMEVLSASQQTPRKVKPATQRPKPQAKGKQTGRKPARVDPQRAAKAKAKKAAKKQGQGVGKPEQVTPTRTPKPDVLGETLATLERKANEGTASGADLQGLDQQLTTATSDKASQVAGTRLRRTLGDLQQRASRAPLKAEDVAALREQWADTRVDRELRALTARAGRQFLKPDNFDALTSMLKERAQAAQRIDPKAETTRKRLQASLARLQEKARNEQVLPEDIKALRAELDAERLDRALSDLERRTLAKNASAADVARVNDQIDDHTKASKVDPKLGQKLRAAIAKLEGRALRGEVTQAEFAELRASLTRRARNAASK